MTSPLLEPLVTGLHAALRRACLRLALAALAVFLALMGLVLLVGGAFLWLAARLEPDVASAVTGGALLLVAAAIALVVWRRGRGTAGRAPKLEPGERGAGGIADLLAAARAAMPSDLGADLPVLAAIAALAGCAVGASPRLRRAIAALAR